MTDTTITNNPTTTIPARSPRPSIPRRNRLVLAGVLAVGLAAGATALVAVADTDGSTQAPAVAVERTAPAAAGSTMSADAYERWAVADAEAYQRLATAEAAERQAQLELSERAARERVETATAPSSPALEQQARVEMARRASACRNGGIPASAVDAIERCLAGANR